MKISCNVILDLVAKFHFDKHNNYSVKSLKMDKWFHLLINIYCRRTRSSSQRNCTGRPPSIDTEGLRVNGYWRIDIVNLTMIYRSKDSNTLQHSPHVTDDPNKRLPGERKVVNSRILENKENNISFAFKLLWFL